MFVRGGQYLISLSVHGEAADPPLDSLLHVQLHPAGGGAGGLATFGGGLEGVPGKQLGLHQVGLSPV